MISLLVVTLFCYALIYFQVTAPYVWIAIVGVAYCAWQVRSRRAVLARLAWLNLGVAILVLGALETQMWLTSSRPDRFERGYEPHHAFIEHRDYGYGPAGGSRMRVRKIHPGDPKPIYDVVYSINDDGLRVSPPDADPAHRRGCVLFFGCSYTFGEGVEDDETLPWQVGVKTGGTFAVRNFGYHGWGPHQMLAALESGNAERAAHCKVTHIVYLALYWHAIRSAGRVFWDRDGPRYLLDEHGSLVRAGYFSDAPVEGPLPKRIIERLKPSFVYEKYFSHRLDPFAFPTTHEDLDLLAALVGRSREEAARRFPGVEFHVLFWNNALGDRWTSDFTDRVSRTGVQLHMTTDAITDYRDEDRDARYVLSPTDLHPSPAAYGLLADYVVSHVLENGVRASSAAPRTD